MKYKVVQLAFFSSYSSQYINSRRLSARLCINQVGRTYKLYEKNCDV